MFLYLSLVRTSFGSPPTLDCFNGTGKNADVMQWPGLEVEYVVEDFGASACSNRNCHIMSYSACQAALDAYRRVCRDATHGSQDTVEDAGSYWGTPGCHVAMQDGEIQWAFNNNYDESGSGCMDDHHPVCIINGTSTRECQVVLPGDATRKCSVMWLHRLELLLVYFAAGLNVLLLPVYFYSCCHDPSKGYWPPRCAGCCAGGCCCQRKQGNSFNAARSASSGQDRSGVVVGAPAWTDADDRQTDQE